MKKKMLLRWMKTEAVIVLLLTACLIQQPATVLADETEASAMISETEVRLDMDDGEYTIDVTLEGGSGRASIASPAALIVKDGYACAHIEWSSSNYDYMKIGDMTYYPVNTDGNSVFEIPVSVFDQEMAVIADTTAMSTAHEIAYTLTFHSDSIADGKSSAMAAGVILVIVIIFAGIAGIIVCKRKRA